MKLVALNTDFAVIEDDGREIELDAFTALRDLVAIKSWGSAIAFLQAHACNSAFFIDADKEFCSFKRPPDHYELPFKRPLAFKNNDLEHLERELSKWEDVEILDSLVRDDYREKTAGQIYLSDLSTFRSDITAFLRLSAVALGASIPEKMFIELPTAAFYDEGWISEVFSKPIGNCRTFALSLEQYGVSKQGIFGDEHFIQSDNPFTSSLKCYIDKNAYFGIEEYPHDVLGSKCFLFNDQLALLTTPLDYNTEAAKRLLASAVVEVLLNSGIDFIEGYSFQMPYYGKEHADLYVFEPSQGFKFVKGRPYPFWVEELFDEAVRLILSRQVSLCPICGSLVMARDNRGCKPRVFCSDTCKTRASNKRREEAIRLAVKGTSIEKAIRIIGSEYETSIRRWYDEAFAIQQTKTQS